MARIRCLGASLSGIGCKEAGQEALKGAAGEDQNQVSVMSLKPIGNNKVFPLSKTKILTK